MPSIPHTHPNTLNSSNTQNSTQSPNRKRKTLLHVETELQIPTINPLASNWQGNDVWRYKENLVKKLAQGATANHAFNAVY
eukprot:1149218-Pelagomonas_calceolata.AAC.2